MLRHLAPLALALAACAALLPGARAQDDKRSAEAILADLDATKVPQPDMEKVRAQDREYIQSFIKEMTAAREKRGKLALELLHAEPKNERLPKLLIERWQGMGMGDTDELAKEIDEAVAATGDESLKAEGLFVKARSTLMTPNPDMKAVLAAVNAYAAVAPKGDRRAASLLFQAASQTLDNAEKVALEDRILKDYPAMADRVKGIRHQREGVGKPFELTFNEAITGKPIDVQKDLKGKVVVVDFWATWCGPCVAEMPTMKKLYAEFKDKGVEFVGVSLDQPEESGKGLTALKTFVAENEIAWPQYYQGNFWQSEFSMSWGINAIPCVFIVDKAGNLYSTEARGKLEELIPELLAKPAAEDAPKGD
jgi:thiol-disulfide isomerase/thioredoxin